jgi:hypothetical protein
LLLYYTHKEFKLVFSFQGTLDKNNLIIGFSISKPAGGIGAKSLAGRIPDVIGVSFNYYCVFTNLFV